MTSEQLSRTVADLEQYVTEVWDARKLWHIATALHLLDCDPDDEEQGDNQLTHEQHRATWKKYADDLDDHLFAAYRNATQRTNEVLSEVVGHDGVEVLLERLSKRAHNLIAPENGRWAWRGITPGDVMDYIPPDLIEQNDLLTLTGVDIEKDHTQGVLRIADWIWSQIRRDVDYYIAKLATHIDQFRATTSERAATEPSVNPERIRWNDTAARFGQLIHDLADKGYLSPPQRAGKPNWTAAARTFHAAFDICTEGDEPVTLSTLTQALKPEGDRDIKGGKAAFKITPRQG